jgi:hypothetical protein
LGRRGASESTVDGHAPGGRSRCPDPRRDRRNRVARRGELAGAAAVRRWRAPRLPAPARRRRPRPVPAAVAGRARLGPGRRGGRHRDRPDRHPAARQRVRRARRRPADAAGGGRRDRPPPAPAGVAPGGLGGGPDPGRVDARGDGPGRLSVPPAASTTSSGPASQRCSTRSARCSGSSSCRRGCSSS